MKGFRSFLFAYMLCIAIGASAYDFSAVNADGVTIYYNITSSTDLTCEVTYKTTSYNSYPEETVNIPASVTYNSRIYLVTSIGYRAFYTCRFSKFVTIPNSVTSIGRSAFSNCSSLKSVTIPNSVTSIEYEAFCRCPKLTSIIIPNSVTSIGNSAFSGCTSLPIENNLRYADTYLVEAVDKTLSTYTIKEGTKFIGSSAFSGCSGLTSIEIPNSVTSIGYEAFVGCGGLTSIVVESRNKYYDSRDNCNAIIETATNSLITGCQNTIIPNSVESIGNSAFSGCIGLTSIEIPNSVTSIGYMAFYGCTGLKSVTIPNSVTSIGDEAFQACSLKSLTIGSGVLSIGRGTINSIKTIWLCNTPPTGCENVTSKINYVSNDLYTKFNITKVYPLLSSLFTVDGIKYALISSSDRTCDAIDCVYDSTAVNAHIGETVTYKSIPLKVLNINDYACYENLYIKDVEISNNGYVGYDAFYGCDSIQNLICNNDGYIGDYTFQGTTALDTALISNKGFIGTSAFENSGVRIATLTNTGNVNDKAFYNCTRLEQLTASNDGYLGNQSFQGTTALDTALISNKGYIGTSAFENSGVKVATITNTAEIKNKAFYNCTRLEKLDVSNKGYIGASAFYGATALDTALIGNKGYIGESAFANSGVKIAKVHNKGAVNNSAFSGCARLQDISLGDSITTLGSSVFYACTSLSKVVIPNNITDMGWWIFQDCKALTSVHIGTGIPEIGLGAFSGCSSLPEIEIPKNVKSIGDDTFSGCTSLADVIFADRTTALTLGSNGSNPLFKDCPLDSVYIGGKIQYNTSSSYGYSPFYRNTSLRTVVITDEEEKVYDNEFYGCEGLKAVSIGNGTTSIGNWAFSGCSNLEYFEFGQKTATIGQEAFSDCVKITHIISHAITPPVCGSQALDDISKWDCELIVPKGHSEKYKQANQWKEFFFITESSEEEPIFATSVTIDKSVYSCNVGQTGKATATVKPDDATNKNVIWSSSDKTKLSIDANTGEFRGLATGEVTITARTTDGTELSATATVTIKQLVETITIDKDKYECLVGEIGQATATVKPDDATTKTVKWTSSDPAKLSIDENTGEYKGLAVGEVTITATAIDDSGVFGQATVVVQEPSGIEEISTDRINAKDAIFDLKGRKVETIKAGEVYIRDGRKFIAR